MQGESWRSPGAKASKGVYVPPEGYWFDTSQDDHWIKPAPQDDHSYAAPLGLRVLPVAISHGDPPGARPPERRGEGQAHSAIQLVILVYEVCDGAPPIVEVEWWRRTSQEELTVESEAVTGREP